MKFRSAWTISSICCFCVSGAMAQGVSTPVKNGAELRVEGQNIRAQFYGEGIVRVLKWTPQGSPGKKSLVVIQDRLPDLKVDVKEDASTLTLSSQSLRLEISKQNGSVAYWGTSGEPLLREIRKATFTPVVYSGDKGFSLQQNFVLSPEEGLFGLGQHQDGILNFRGHSEVLAQSNTDAAIPLLVSTKGYGILWDNTSKTVFKDGPEGMSLWSDIGDNLDYYFIRGAGMDGVVAGYRDLTGPAPMYGKWAYGYWQSKEHYHTQEEVMNVAREYRKRGIPVDNLVQDWNYWGNNNNWSGMTFTPDRYPKPAEMVKTLHDLNYHMMISIWPGLGPDSAIYKEMDQKGFLYKPVGWAGFRYYDAFNPAANDVYWKHLKAGLYSKGIDAWWIDSTEPDIVNALTKDSEEYEMKRVENTHLGSWARHLNAYSLVMTGSLYDHLRQESDRRRAYILTRSVFAGQQRNAATTWSGDIGASWDIYRKQITAGLNFCMAGVPYWTFDIGGFVLGSYGGVFADGIKDPAYQELYTRMFQFGAFSPIFRAHGSEGPREIYEFGEFSDALVQADRLRYRLMPYIYSQAWQVTSRGGTIMRGLPMDFAKDPKTYGIGDQFMFGPSIMACPVTEYMLHRPPESCVPLTSANLRTKDGQPGLMATYCKDAEHKNASLQRIEPQVDLYWYTGRPDFATDTTFSVRWEGMLVPSKTGKHQLLVKNFGTRHLHLDGKELPFLGTGTLEGYTPVMELKAGRAYHLVVEVENTSSGAAKGQLFWKTPELFAQEKKVVDRPQTRSVYLPVGTDWVDYWTGVKYAGGQSRTFDAPIERIPLLVKVGSILPLGPDIQFASEKPADPIELRIYPGADGRYTLYEDEGDTYNYEKGARATIDFRWNEGSREFVLEERKGSFPGMLTRRNFHLVLVSPGHGIGLELSERTDKVISYTGTRQVIQF